MTIATVALVRFFSLRIWVFEFCHTSRPWQPTTLRAAFRNSCDVYKMIPTQVSRKVVVQSQRPPQRSPQQGRQPKRKTKICFCNGTRYCRAWGQHSFETNKLTMFLETEASFPYCNRSTKMAGIIWLGSTSVQHVNNWQRLSCLPFLSLCKRRKFLETKTYSFISIKKKIICKKKFQKYLVQIWFA